MKASIDKEMQLLQTPLAIVGVDTGTQRNGVLWIASQRMQREVKFSFWELESSTSVKQKLDELGRGLSWLSACCPAQGPELEPLATM